MTHLSIKLISKLLIVIALFTGTTLRSSAQSNNTPPNINHTVFILGYAQGNGTLISVRSFNGVLLSKSLIITAHAAINDPIASLTPLPPVDQYRALIRWKDDAILVKVAPRKPEAKRAPLIMFEIDGLDQNKIDAMVKSTPTIGDYAANQPHSIHGVLSPFDILPEEVNTLVPLPMSFDLRTSGQSNSLPRGMTETPIAGVLQPQLLGSGVWNQSNELVGILAKLHDHYSVISIAPLKDRFNNGNTNSNTNPVPDNGTPPKPITKPQITSSPDKLNSQEFADLLAKHSLTLKIHAQLVDYVNQEQADLIMAYIASGEYSRAKALLDEFESLSSGLFAEQLNYRRALLLTLSGNYKDAIEKSRNALNATDPLVRARGGTLFRVLVKNADGTFNGKPLSDSMNLAAAIQDSLTELADKFYAALELIQKQKLEDTTSYETINNNLITLENKISINELNWPGYLKNIKQLIIAHRLTLAEQEYDRSRQNLQQLYDEVQSSKQQLEFKTGPDWYKPGYYPLIHVSRINVTINKYNAAHRQYHQLNKIIKPENRVPLPDDLAKPIDLLSVAVRASIR